MRSPPLAEADVLPDPELTPFTLCYDSFQGWVTPSLMVGGTGQGGVVPATGSTEPTVSDWATPSLVKRKGVAWLGGVTPVHLGANAHVAQKLCWLRTDQPPR
jgi:hypothetical protein